MKPRRAARWLALLLPLLLAAGCSSGSDAAETDGDAAGPADPAGASASTAPSSPVTSRPDADQSHAGQSGSNQSDSGQQSTQGSSGGNTWPLTGEPVGSGGTTTGSSAARPAIVVKIDNHDDARPQYGLLQADIVYEQVVEFGLTRFAAIYHSTDIDVAGPVRSVRITDFGLVSNLGVALLASSGGTEGVLEQLSEVDVINVGSHVDSRAYWRQPGLFAPHNLMTSTWQLRELAGQPAAPTSAATELTPTAPPAALFSYADPDEEAPTTGVDITGVAVRGVDIDFGDTEVTYRWSPGIDAWLRTQDEVPHIDAEGGLVAPANVVVQFVVYGRSEVDPRSPEAELIGSGEVWVLTRGSLIQGSWSRAESDEPTQFTDAAGQAIGLTPGKTWVALVRVGQAQIAD